MPDMEEAASQYRSYRALLEDKKRCLTDIPHVQHDKVNSLRRQGEDHKTSQSAMAELKRHMRMDLEKTWDPNRPSTPPHPYLVSEEMPHVSRRELEEKKLKMQATLRKRERRSGDQGRAPEAERVSGKDRPHSAPAKGPSPKMHAWEAPTMNDLMQPGGAAMGGIETEKAVLVDRRRSSRPHVSQQVLNLKKRYHATPIHQKRQARSQSARDLGSPAASDIGPDPAYSSYQGEYPHGRGNHKWASPGGGHGDPKKVGRYDSQAYLLVDKRRHAAPLDGDVAHERARAKSEKQHGSEVLVDDGDGFYQPNFLARGEKYRSQYALAQHKRRHLAELHSEADTATATASPSSPCPRSPSDTELGLHTSQKSLDYGKRGHVVALRSARELRRQQQDCQSDGSSSCDVGKGIMRMMHTHSDSVVHVSALEFGMKKKNHATSVHVRPRSPRGEGSEASSEGPGAGAALADRRRPSEPHDSCKAFTLKKKYHQTQVHVKNDSRLNPSVTKEKPLDVHPKVINSQAQLNRMKKIHKFDHNAEEREKSTPKPVPTAPLPRTGQWTPQHILD